MFVRTESFREFIQFYPIVTCIILIHLLLYILMNIPVFPSAQLFEELIGVNLYIKEGEVWRLVTPIFMHSNFSHMLFNSFSILLFGPGIERILGKTKFIILYLLTGILANIATFLLQPLTYTHVGSSGAIFGLFGIYIAIVMFRKDLLSRENSQIILTITAIGLIMTFFQPNINITAHLFGLFSGFLLGRLYLGRTSSTQLSFNIKKIFSKSTNHRFTFSVKHIIIIIIILLAIIGFIK